MLAVVSWYRPELAEQRSLLQAIVIEHKRQLAYSLYNTKHLQQIVTNELVMIDEYVFTLWCSTLKMKQIRCFRV